MSLMGRGRNAAGYSVVDDRLVLRGDLDTDGTVRVDGRVEGKLHRAGTLIVGRSGVVVGDVEAKEVVVAGRVLGNVQARGRIEIDTGASVHGEIQAYAMLLREGGVIDGSMSIGAKPPAASAPPPSTNRRLELTPAPAASNRGR